MKLILSTVLIFLLTAGALAQPDELCGSAFSFRWKPVDLGKYKINQIMDESNELIHVSGIGYEHKLNNKWSLEGGLSVGIKSTEQEISPANKEDWSYTRLGISAGPTWYPHGYDTDKVRFSVGAMINYSTYSYDRETTNGSNTDKLEFSSSTLGLCLHAGADFEIYDNVKIGARYELEFESMPKTERTVTSNGQSNTTDGPGMTFFGTGFGGVFLKILF